MARTKIRIQSSAPVTVLFAVICILLFILQHTYSQSFMTTMFTVGGNTTSANAFDRGSLLDYITIFTHIFGNTSWTHLALSLSIILVLGQNIEEAYGKGVLVLMFTITAFISGVLSTLFVSTQLSGPHGIAILFLILSILSNAKTKSIPISILFVSVLYVVSIFFDSSKISVSEKIVPFIGALCASIFGFIDFFEQMKPASRKKKASQ